jgi:hypothetical protein
MCGVERKYPNFISTIKPRKERCIKMSINDKYVYAIEIDTMQDAKDIVAIATKLKGRIVLRSGSKFSVNAKSLLGVLLAKKLNWNNMTIEMDNDYYHEFEKFIAC